MDIDSMWQNGNVRQRRYQCFVEKLCTARERLTPVIDDVISTALCLMHNEDIERSPHLVTPRQYEDIVYASQILQEIEYEFKNRSRPYTLPNCNVIVNNLNVDYPKSGSKKSIVLNEELLNELLEVYDRLGQIIKRIIDEGKAVSVSDIIRDEPIDEEYPDKENQLEEIESERNLALMPPPKDKSTLSIVPRKSSAEILKQPAKKPSNVVKTTSDEPAVFIKIKCFSDGTPNTESENDERIPPCRACDNGIDEHRHVRLDGAPITLKLNQNTISNGRIYCINAGSDDTEEDIKIVIKQCPECCSTVIGSTSKIQDMFGESHESITLHGKYATEDDAYSSGPDDQMKITDVDSEYKSGNADKMAVPSIHINDYDDVETESLGGSRKSKNKLSPSDAYMGKKARSRTSVSSDAEQWGRSRSRISQSGGEERSTGNRMSVINEERIERSPSRRSTIDPRQRDRSRRSVAPSHIAEPREKSRSRMQMSQSDLSRKTAEIEEYTCDDCTKTTCTNRKCLHMKCNHCNKTSCVNKFCPKMNLILDVDNLGMSKIEIENNEQAADCECQTPAIPKKISVSSETSTSNLPKSSVAILPNAHTATVRGSCSCSNGKKKSTVKLSNAFIAPKSKSIIELTRNKICSSMEFDVTGVDTQLRENPIEHSNEKVQGDLRELGVNQLLRACRPAKCCRKAILDEKQKIGLPYSVSLKSLPLVADDVDVIQQSIDMSVRKIKKSPDISQNYTNKMAYYVSLGRDDFQPNVNFPWVMPALSMEFDHKTVKNSAQNLKKLKHIESSINFSIKSEKEIEIVEKPTLKRTLVMKKSETRSINNITSIHEESKIVELKKSDARSISNFTSVRKESKIVELYLESKSDHGDGKQDAYSRKSVNQDKTVDNVEDYEPSVKKIKLSSLHLTPNCSSENFQFRLQKVFSQINNAPIKCEKLYVLRKCTRSTSRSYLRKDLSTSSLKTFETSSSRNFYANIVKEPTFNKMNHESGNKPVHLIMKYKTKSITTISSLTPIFSDDEKLSKCNMRTLNENRVDSVGDFLPPSENSIIDICLHEMHNAVKEGKLDYFKYLQLKKIFQSHRSNEKEWSQKTRSPTVKNPIPENSPHRNDSITVFMNPKVKQHLREEKIDNSTSKATMEKCKFYMNLGKKDPLTNSSIVPPNCRIIYFNFKRRNKKQSTNKDDENCKKENSSVSNNKHTEPSSASGLRATTSQRDEKLTMRTKRDKSSTSKRCSIGLQTSIRSESIKSVFRKTSEPVSNCKDEVIVIKRNLNSAKSRNSSAPDENSRRKRINSRKSVASQTSNDSDTQKTRQDNIDKKQNGLESKKGDELIPRHVISAVIQAYLCKDVNFDRTFPLIASKMDSAPSNRQSVGSQMSSHEIAISKNDLPKISGGKLERCSVGSQISAHRFEVLPSIKVTSKSKPETKNKIRPKLQSKNKNTIPSESTVKNMVNLDSVKTVQQEKKKLGSGKKEGLNPTTIKNISNLLGDSDWAPHRVSASSLPTIEETSEKNSVANPGDVAENMQNSPPCGKKPNTNEVVGTHKTDKTKTIKEKKPQENREKSARDSKKSNDVICKKNPSAKRKTSPASARAEIRPKKSKQRVDVKQGLQRDKEIRELYKNEAMMKGRSKKPKKNNKD